MVKHDVSEENLRRYKKQGWNFFIRTVAERRYITIRRRGKERSLGSYSDDLWKVIESIDNKGPRKDIPRSLINKLEPPKGLTQSLGIGEAESPFHMTVEEINQYIVIYKFQNCLRIEADGFCGYWRLEELPDHGIQLNQMEMKFFFKKLKQDNGKTDAWALKPLPSICHGCPAYVDEKMINFIKSSKL